MLICVNCKAKSFFEAHWPVTLISMKVPAGRRKPPQ